MELFSKLIFINLLQELIWDDLINDHHFPVCRRPFLLIQVTFSFYYVLLFLGENWSWLLRSLSHPERQEPIVDGKQSILLLKNLWASALGQHVKGAH